MPNPMLARWRQEVEQHPLRTALAVGLVLRLIAAIFARGFMATDDHYQVIELAARWLRGRNDYLAGDEQFYRPLLYPSLNWALIKLCHAVGIVHPDAVMFINRLLHAVFSLWTIGLTYRLALLLAEPKAAFMAAMVMAAHCVMPYVAVRNLIEVVAMPLLLAGIYEITQAERAPGAGDRRWLLGGLAFGLAILIRWQAATAIAGVGVYLLVRRRWRGLALVVLGSLVPLVAEGLWDWSAHGVFLGSLWAYIAFNAEHAYDYVVGPWYFYLLLTVGLFVPPFSLLGLVAAGRYLKRLGILAWATLPFLIIHSAIPGKQERFLLPIFPEMVLMFVIALWHWEREHSETWRRWIRYGWRFFWAVNVILLAGTLTNYAQRGKIEPLIGIYEAGDAKGVIVDETARHSRTQLPVFYADGGGVRPNPRFFLATTPGQIDSVLAARPGFWNYVIVFPQRRFDDEHRRTLESRLGRLEVVRRTGPTLVENILFYFNPKHNHTRDSWLFRIKQSNPAP